MSLPSDGKFSCFKNILIIDDEPFILDIFSQFLSDEGYDIQAAESNDVAMEYLQQNVFDLILLDVHMRGTGFSDFLAYLKKPSSEHSKTPIIAVTGVPDVIQEIDRRYLSGILEKPFTPEVMISCIQSVL